jgi:hypothetical protein
LLVPAIHADIGAAEVLLFIEEEGVIRLLIGERFAAGFTGVAAGLDVPFVHLKVGLSREENLGANAQ